MENETIKKVSLKCTSCNGVLTVDSDKSVLVCPYCGARELIIENDAVKIEQIRANAQRDIEMERIRSAENQQIRAEANMQRQAERNDMESFKKGKFGKIILVAFILSIILAFICFSQSHILAGVLAVVQAGCFGVAWCMGMKIIKEKKRYIHILIAIAGALLIIPMLKSCTSDNQNANVVKVDWSVIFLGSEIPQPTSDEMEIHSNTSDDLWIEIVRTSDEEYYKYITKCKELGYTIEANETSIGYDAYNESGYKISLSYYDEKMTIRVDAPTQMATLDWENHNISAVLPTPNSNTGVFEVENNDSTTVIVGEITAEQFEEYCNLCRNQGFVVDAKSENTSFTAYDERGYQIQIFYTSGSREMKIILDNPMEFSTITLPSVGISTLIPVPPSLSGKVGSNYDWTYSVYLENMTKEDYSAYIQECTKAGFSKDVRDYGDSYWADYKDDDDISINVSYEGNNIVYISITGSLNDDYSDYKRKGSIFENNSTSTVKNEEQTPSSTTSSVTTTTATSSTTTATTSLTTTTVVTEPTILSEYERAFIRDLSNYDMYYMFDEDTNTVINFVTNDTSVMKGTYSGDFSTGVTIDFTSYGDNWYEKLIYSSGSKATLIDGNGFEWNYEICDVAKAQSVRGCIPNRVNANNTHKKVRYCT